jgi:hypothetical protein
LGCDPGTTDSTSTQHTIVAISRFEEDSGLELASETTRELVDALAEALQ